MNTEKKIEALFGFGFCDDLIIKYFKTIVNQVNRQGTIKQYIYCIFLQSRHIRTGSLTTE